MKFRKRFARYDKSAKIISSDESTLPPCLPTVPAGLTVLHPDGDDKSALVDIITVHGLSGHPLKTWTNFTTDHYWPLHSLPEDIPQSRIMTFGYNTGTSPFNGSTAIISDISKQLIAHLINKRTSEGQRQRPIIFIAHSLGGIVIKEFLHVASNTGHEDLVDCVCGVLFLGTPHRGSQTANFMDVVSGVLKSLLLRPADAVIKDLSSNGRHLLELDQLLRFRLAKIDIYSFYELLPMRPMKSPIVERHSALLNIPTELEQIGLEADHRQMCKPPDRNSFIYETIVQRIISIMDRQVSKAQYSKDLIEMTNRSAGKRMERISALMKELQIGPDAMPMMALPQQTISFHIPQTREPGATHTHGFEEILKWLPVAKVNLFVNGIHKFTDRAESLQDLLLEAERQNERRKAQARIDAERKTSERQIYELKAKIARLEARLGEGNGDYVRLLHDQPSDCQEGSAAAGILEPWHPASSEEVAVPVHDAAPIRPALSSDDAPPAPGPNPTSPRSSQVPGAFADDLAFAAPLAVGLQDSGSDPNIVIDDAAYRTCDSLPGSNEHTGVYMYPLAETVADLSAFGIISDGVPKREPGYIIDKVAETPASASEEGPPLDELESASARCRQSESDGRPPIGRDDIETIEEPVDETPRLSKREWRKLEKAASREAVYQPSVDQLQTPEGTPRPWQESSTSLQSTATTSGPGDSEDRQPPQSSSPYSSEDMGSRLVRLLPRHPTPRRSDPTEPGSEEDEGRLIEGCRRRDDASSGSGSVSLTLSTQVLGVSCWSDTRVEGGPITITGIPSHPRKRKRADSPSEHRGPMFADLAGGHQGHVLNKRQCARAAFALVD